MSAYFSLSGPGTRSAGRITQSPFAPLGHGAVDGARNMATARLVILLVTPPYQLIVINQY